MTHHFDLFELTELNVVAELLCVGLKGTSSLQLYQDLTHARYYVDYICPEFASDLEDSTKVSHTVRKRRNLTVTKSPMCSDMFDKRSIRCAIM